MDAVIEPEFSESFSDELARIAEEPLAHRAEGFAQLEQELRRRLDDSTR
ncbi:hypothetical protein C8A06_0110 [Microbacteriaceae bacterium MWH-Ta3]|nr:hypothetical protein C8A06_0110 [Microbacteriaceae bacterium MWH-Ta3]